MFSYFIIFRAAASQLLRAYAALTGEWATVARRLPERFRVGSRRHLFNLARSLSYTQFNGQPFSYCSLAAHLVAHSPGSQYARARTSASWCPRSAAERSLLRVLPCAVLSTDSSAGMVDVASFERQGEALSRRSADVLVSNCWKGRNLAQAQIF